MTRCLDWSHEHDLVYFIQTLNFAYKPFYTNKIHWYKQTQQILEINWNYWSSKSQNVIRKQHTKIILHLKLFHCRQYSLNKSGFTSEDRRKTKKKYLFSSKKSNFKLFLSTVTKLREYNNCGMLFRFYWSCDKQWLRDRDFTCKSALNHKMGKYKKEFPKKCILQRD